MSYSYRRKDRYSHEYKPYFGKGCGYDYDDDYESYLDDYTTSAISYETVKIPRSTYPHTRSEYGRKRHRERESCRYKSPAAGYDDYLKQDEALLKRTKQTRNDIENVFYQLGLENNKFKKKERQSRSPRRLNDDGDSIYEGSEDIYDYEKYFEKTRPKDKNSKKYEKEDIFGEDRKRSHKQKNYSRKENDHQVYTCKEPKLHEKVFRSKDKNREKSPSSSEILIKTTDYPILAFKNNDVSQDKSKKSSTFYLPTIYCNTESSNIQDRLDSPGTKQRTQSSPPGNAQVFAANIDEKSNIFHREENVQNKHDLTNEAEPELKTEESLLSGDAQLKESNVKTSTETQTDESFSFEHKFPLHQKYRNTGSILNSILEKEEKRSKLTENYPSRDQPKIKKNKNAFAYQIDIDIEPVKREMFRSRLSNIDPIDEAHKIVCKQIEDPLHDDYPVTKDYVKVSDNCSIKVREAINSNIRQPKDKSAKESTDVKDKFKHNTCAVSHSEPRKYQSVISSRDPVISKGTSDMSRIDDFVVKDISDSIFKRVFEQNADNNNHRASLSNPKDVEFDFTVDNCWNSEKVLEPQNVHVFRSKVNNEFKKSITKIPSRVNTHQENQAPTKESSQEKLPEMNDNSSILSFRPNRQSQVPQTFKGEVGLEEQVESQREKKSGIRESRLQGQIENYPSTDRRSKSIVRESKVHRKLTDSSSVSRGSQPLVRQSKVKRPMGSTLVDNESQPVIRQSKVDRQPGSSVIAQESQPVTRHSKLDKRADSSLIHKESQPLIRGSKVENSNYATDKFEKRESEAKNTRTFHKHSYVDKPRESKSILRIKNKSNAQSKGYGETSEQTYSKNTDIQYKSIDIDDVPPKGEKTSTLRDSQVQEKPKSGIIPSKKSEPKKKTSKLSNLFSKSKNKTKSINEKKVPNKSMKQSDVTKSEGYSGEEIKSNISPLSNSTMGSKPSRYKFSRLFSRSKSKIRSDKDDFEPQSEENPQQKSKKQQIKDTQSQASIKSEVDKKSKGKSQAWSFLKRSKPKNESETTLTEQQPQPDETPRETTSEISVEPENKQKRTSETSDKQEKKQKPENGKNKGDGNKEEKNCECIIQYVKQAREYGYFFLGPTLHEQLMDILKIV